VPQVFVGGQFLGGCTETLEAFDSGDLQSRLEAADVEFTRDLGLEAKSFLPGWLHAREESA
jgi:cysteine synthase A